MTGVAQGAAGGAHVLRFSTVGPMKVIPASLHAWVRSGLGWGRVGLEWERVCAGLDDGLST